MYRLDVIEVEEITEEELAVELAKIEASHLPPPWLDSMANGTKPLAFARLGHQNRGEQKR